MRDLRRFAMVIVAGLAAIGTVSAAGTAEMKFAGGIPALTGPLAAGSEGVPVLLAQQLKAPGTVEKRVLKRLPPGIVTTKPLDPQAVLKEDCTWTNGGVAQCLVWDCDEDDVCVEYGEYCVDRYGHTIAC